MSDIKTSRLGGIAYGNYAGRPANPEIGQLYSNGEAKRLEVYTPDGWNDILQNSYAAPEPEYYEWVRPSDWLSITDPLSTEQKLVGLVAVFDRPENFIAFAMATTDASQYTVNWGDGTTTDHDSGTTAQKNYLWSDISSSTLTTREYRQAIITVTPKNNGATFTEVNLNRKHSTITTTSSNIVNPWLDIAVSAPNATIMSLSGRDNSATQVTNSSIVERVNIVSHNVQSFSSTFSDMFSLQSVILSNTSNVISTASMFTNCYSLRSVPLFDTSNVTSMASMFVSCFKLRSVPLFNTSNVTTMASMFNGCSNLISVPYFNTSKVTAMNSMFSSCANLENVPLFDTSNVTTMASMFSSCFHLKNVPAFNTSKVTSMSSMFNSCNSLENVPLFNTSNVTTMSSMFSGCNSLENVPSFNTSKVTSMSSMFSSCANLENVPLFDTSLVTTMSSMFSSCVALTTVPLFNTPLVTTMSTMFNGCNSLENVPLFNTSNVTDMTNMFSSTSNLKSVPLFDTSKVTNMSSMFSSSFGLEFVPNFNTPLLTNVASMFSVCRSLKVVPSLNLISCSSAANGLMAIGSSSTTSSAGSVNKVLITGNRWTQTFQNCNMSATELNSMYTNLPVLNPSITNVSASGGVVTYTVGAENIAPFLASRTVSITGVNPSAYNISGTIAAVNSTNGTFTITNAAIGTYVSGGVATITDNKTITVTGNYGTASDDTTIATNKGWTVTG
jgi:surface protein